MRRILYVLDITNYSPVAYRFYQLTVHDLSQTGYDRFAPH